MYRIVPFANDRETRALMFNAYQKRFHSDEAMDKLLELLRVRNEAAQTMGLPSWAHYRLKSLCVNSPKAFGQMIKLALESAQPELQAFRLEAAKLAVAASGHVQRRGSIRFCFCF